MWKGEDPELEIWEGREVSRLRFGKIWRWDGGVGDGEIGDGD